MLLLLAYTLGLLLGAFLAAWFYDRGRAGKSPLPASPAAAIAARREVKAQAEREREQRDDEKRRQPPAVKL